MLCVCVCAHVHTQARLMIPENAYGLACVRVSISAEIKADAVFYRHIWDHYSKQINEQRMRGN